MIGTIAAGEAEIIKHHIVVYTGPSDDAALREAWEAYSGQGEMYSTASLWGIAQQEGLEAEFLTPERAVEEMTTMDGFRRQCLGRRTDDDPADGLRPGTIKAGYGLLKTAIMNPEAAAFLILATARF